MKSYQRSQRIFHYLLNLNFWIVMILGGTIAKSMWGYQKEGTAMINGDVASKVVRLFSKMAQSNIAISVEERDVQDLKDTEWKIIALVGTGLSNKEISAKLNLSEGTVRNALSTVLQKLQLRDRTQLAIWAVQTGAAGREFD